MILIHLIKQLFGDIVQSLVGEFAVVPLITFGSSMKELARVFMYTRELRSRTDSKIRQCDDTNVIQTLVQSEGYCACKCNDLLYCSILGGKTYKVPSSYLV